MKKDKEPAQDAQGSTLSFRHKRILASDERILAAHQGVKDEPKTDLFNLREYRQAVML